MRSLLIVICILCAQIRYCRCEEEVKLGKLLMKLDDNITDILLSPRRKDGVTLIKNIVFYTRSLIEMTEKVNEQDESVQVGAKCIFNNKGPEFLRTELDIETLLEILDWTIVDYKNLLFLLADAAAAYKGFTRAYKMNIVWFL